jgi:hypothetical protein
MSSSAASRAKLNKEVECRCCSNFLMVEGVKMSYGWGSDGYCPVKTKRVFSIRDMNFRYTSCDDFDYIESSQLAYACFLQYVFDERIKILRENKLNIGTTIEWVAKTVATHIKATIPVYRNITYTCAVQSIERKFGNEYREEIDDMVKQMLLSDGIEMPVELGIKINHANIFGVLKSLTPSRV